MKKRLIYIRTVIFLLSAMLSMAFVPSCANNSGSEETAVESDGPVSHSEMLAAIPSDAAAVLCFQNARNGLSVLTDPANCFSTLISGNSSFRNFVMRLSGADVLKSQQMAVSLHFAGTLEPMLAIDFGKSSEESHAQKKIRHIADSLRLSSSVASHGGVTFMVISGSETVASSSVRHIEGGLSILDNKKFASVAKKMTARDVLFFSNDYADKLMAAFLARPLRKYIPFFKEAADWTAFDIREVSQKRVLLQGRAMPGESRSHYAHVLLDQPDADCRYAQVTPESSWFALSRSFNDVGQYYKSYVAYLDASMSLNVHQIACDTLTRHFGSTPQKWAENMGIREIATARWKGLDGKESSAVFFRTAKARKGGEEIAPCDYADMLTVIFGKVFSPGKQPVCVSRGEWTAVGKEACVMDWVSAFDEGRLLQAYLDGMNVTQPHKNASMVAYFSFGGAVDHYDDLFRTALASDAASSLEGTCFEPAFLSFSKEGLDLEVTRIPVTARNAAGANPSLGGSASSSAYRMQVEVPAGPFVIQSADGKNVLFYQNSHNSLCLKEESGKGIWGIPFSTPMCGEAAGIDYFGNGKVQILFAAGSRLYLIDRLGRFVKGFPVDLGKEVLLGPKLSGTYPDYQVMVLHKDNSIGMYDLEGTPVPGWKGISAEDTILGYPETVMCGDMEFKVVRTLSQTLIFRADGGENLWPETGKKVIDRDSEITAIGDKALSFTCADGKTRKLKMKQINTK